MSDDFQIKVVVLGPERTVETNYGPRTERDTHALLEVPVTGELAWRIFQNAVAEAVTPILRIEYDA